jgi:hypothetical protein
MAHVRVSAGFSGKIPTGSFQNSAPSFHAEIEFDTNDTGPDLLAEIDATQKQLHAMSYQNFKIVADAARIEKVKNDLRGFRFYKGLYGEYPSVTTVIDPDFKPWCSEEELKIATSEGNISHARAAHFIATGEWVEVKKLEGVASDLIVCKGRMLDGWDFPAFLKKYPLTNMKNGRTLINDEHRYAGTNDGECLYPLGGEKVAAVVPTIFDFKRTPSKDKNFTQMAAYAKCMEGIQQMMIIPADPDNNQGFSKPILSTAIDKYFEVFIDKRKAFGEVYGI